MADGDNNSGGSGTGGTTFTQADVNRMIAEERRRTEALFGDYGELKKRAEDAEKTAAGQKSDIDKLTDAVTKLTERTAESEAKLARADAAKKHSLPDWVVAKLTGKTAEDADREAKEWHDNLKASGWNPDGAGGGAGAGAGNDGESSTTGGAANTSGTTGQSGSTTTAGGGQQGGSNSGGATGARGGGRPREDLRSGTAGAAGGGGQDEDVSKIADSIMSRAF